MVVSFQGDHKDQESDEVAKNNINGGDSSSSIDGGLVSIMKQEESASKKHALSERKRRKRINNHYDSLRRFFPQLLKTDKASVLSETVRHIKELKNMVADLALSHDEGTWCSDNISRQPFFIPGEKDEVSVIYCDGSDKTTVRAVICCDDRPDLNQGLTEAIRSVCGKVVKAEMATVGGRTKVDVVVEWPQFDDGGMDVGLLRRALKAVVENQILFRSGFTGCGPTEPECVGLGLRFVDGLRPNLFDQTENGYVDGLISSL
ncbi:hypothetical protein L1987_64133 [Smallanthus sonchifolius]|uniref:Uncharacterized protein n=1 Tax=Smallanthus sonchifolius TaxID=185202 RepID=A0ACB9CF78_9ASTR|nr:hypothetical protein L1987_64133 [Smallanthus sonchifolius]